MQLGDREFTSEEVAALCGVTRVTVADWIARGELRARWTAGGHRRIPRASLADFMSRQGYFCPRRVATREVLVLVVDDEALWRDRLRGDLGQTGDFAVETVRPGIGALLAVGAARPDVLVIDTRMPGFDPVLLIEAVRAEPSLGDTLVVALAAWDEDGPRARRAGADAALGKERAHELIALLGRLLTERQRRVPSDAPTGAPRVAD